MTYLDRLIRLASVRPALSDPLLLHEVLLGERLRGLLAGADGDRGAPGGGADPALDAGHPGVVPGADGLRCKDLKFSIGNRKFGRFSKFFIVR